MRTATVSFILAFTAASLFGQFEAPKELVKLSGSVSARNGDEIQGVVNAEISPTWHINSWQPLEKFSIPTVLSFDDAELVKADFPPHVVRAFTFSAGTKLAVYEGTIAIPFTAKLKPGATALHAKLKYQACNDSVCLPPKTAEAEISLTPSGAPAIPPASAKPAGNFTPLSAAPKDKLPDNFIARTFTERGLALTLLILFVAGLALNLTPCVFPMIPITAGFFAMQSDGRRSRRLLLSALYVLGIVIMYSALGVVAALSGKLFGAWLQHPAVLISLAVLMVVLATSMFGLWEFRVPQFIANRAMGRAGMAGAMTMGMIVGIVAAPCVGPAVAALFALVAAIAKVGIGLALFAALGFGLGFPYLVMLNVLPKPGEWMEQVKKALGFVLLAMAFYFLRPMTGDTIFQWGVAISLLIGAGYLFLRRGATPKGGRAMRLACATLLLVAGAAFAIPRSSKVDGAEWQKYNASLITNAQKPVVIDFYADWCLPCKELDVKTFSDPAVKAEMDRFVRIKADLTNDEDPEVKKLTKQNGIIGVPTIVFLDSKGQEVAAQRLTGFEPPKSFIPRLQQVR